MGWGGLQEVLLAVSLPNKPEGQPGDKVAVACLTRAEGKGAGASFRAFYRKSLAIQTNQQTNPTYREIRVPHTGW